MLKELFGKGDSVVSMLKEDHRKVESLFKEFEEAEDRRTKGSIAQKALQELEVHATLEEELCYPAFRRELEDDEVMKEALEEHHVAHFLIGELKRMGPADDRFPAKFKVLAESVKHHVKEEEAKVLPEVEEADTPELFERVMERKQELMQGRGRQLRGAASTRDGSSRGKQPPAVRAKRAGTRRRRSTPRSRRRSAA